MKNIFCLVFLLTVLDVFAQDRPVSVIDFVQIKNSNRAEAVYYYENNWRRYREIAFQKKYISAYRIITVERDAVSDFDLLLVTEYADSSNYKMGEERFTAIIRSVNPGGPVLLNEKKPGDFREVLFNKEGSVLFSENYRDHL